ncbi:helix-turn-helix transcriptional regulator [Streptomyces sp. NPDC085932]|uniref:helix-turn-helix transcriptional regulator n=1 Tax=Streptomyces sp. NPDC085932 TaxID=3365741 RepID=UPI0037CEABF5
MDNPHPDTDPDTDPATSTGLGPFLRSRRERLTPADVGLSSHGRRRVPGLRRDEVAALAGVSTSYYVRLEQGREARPSRRVLDAVARALRLGEQDTRRLHGLARPAGRRTTSPARVERVAPHLRELIDSWTGTPAFVIGHAQDMLATNPLAEALYADFGQCDNVLRMLFLDPVARTFYRDTDRAAYRAVADLRQAAANTPDDPRILRLVGELSIRSAEFRSLWARDHIRVPPYEVKQVHHSAVGVMELRHEAFAVRSAPGQQLVVLQAEPGSPSADALALLGSLGARDRARDS